VTHGQALNITCQSYAGNMNFGFTGCHSSMPSMQRLAVYTAEALAELEAAFLSAKPAAATRKAAPKPKAAPKAKALPKTKAPAKAKPVATAKPKATPTATPVAAKRVRKKAA